MFFIIVSLLDEGRLSVWVTMFRFGIIVVGVLTRSKKGTEGIGLPVWCIGASEKLVPDVVPGGKFMSEGFWDDVPTC